VLEDDGTFVAKVLAGGAEQQMQTLLKKNFKKVANVKPPASRADSSEKFVVAMGFRGRQVEGGEGWDGEGRGEVPDPEAGPLG
jgi:23S rRNA (uridine2552-2'-O)-methyltransferase